MADGGSTKKEQPARRSEAPDPGSPVARLQAAARRARNEGDAAQAEKFARAARDLDADGDGMGEMLRRLLKP